MESERVCEGRRKEGEAHSPQLAGRRAGQASRWWIEVLVQYVVVVVAVAS